MDNENKEELEVEEADLEKGESDLKKEESGSEMHESDLESEISDLENLDDLLVIDDENTVSKKRAIYDRILKLQIQKVQLDLDIDVSSRLELEDLNKLKITKAFVSFESEEIKNQFESMYSKKVF